MSRLPFIFTHPPNADGMLTIPADEARHLALVLRAKPGARFIAFDGCGNGWTVEIIDLKRDTISARALNAIENSEPEKTKLTVAVGAVKGARMDWAVEKCAEIGVAAFTPLLTEFGVVEPGKSKLERWRSIALAAAKQSRRFQLMAINNPVQLHELLSTKNEISIWALDLNEYGGSLVKRIMYFHLPESLILIIGPEGGFSESERHLLRDRSIPTFNLGRHPLRTETAAALSAALILNAIHSHS
ncbi:MAG: 16S rRNA (uracil(1498)-N(3))-methyltransferase [Calditrichaeota bacterium]|nr:16S rRNA (uracil(1498)-N(3))-methyltransferase [Calditrichota bacterium]